MYIFAKVYEIKIYQRLQNNIAFANTYYGHFILFVLEMHATMRHRICFPVAAAIY